MAEENTLFTSRKSLKRNDSSKKNNTFPFHVYIVHNHILFDFFIFSFLLFLFTTCTGIKTIYNEEVNLSASGVFSKELGFSVNMPVGWRQIDANADQQIALLITDHSNNQSISFQPVKLHVQQSKSSPIRLEEVSDILKTFYKSNNPTLQIANEELFENKGIRFSAFEINSDKVNKRIVVVDYKNNFFECIALSTDVSLNRQQLFSLQNKVLFSLN